MVSKKKLNVCLKMTSLTEKCGYIFEAYRLLRVEKESESNFDLDFRQQLISNFGLTFSLFVSETYLKF